MNDFDKAPGMDSYLDTSRGTKLKVDDFLVRRETNRKDDEKEEKEEYGIPFELY